VKTIFLELSQGARGRGAEAVDMNGPPDFLRGSLEGKNKNVSNYTAGHQNGIEK
jgi:hypothetical protein